jgi:hypothetical protein
MRQRVDDRRLMLAGNHQARALVQLQVAGDLAEPLVDVAVFALFRTVRGAEAGGQRPREFLDIAGTQRQAMVGLHARRRRHRLGHVEPVHVGMAVAHTASGRKLPRVSHARGARAEEVGIEGDDGLRLREIVVRVDRRPERERRAGPRRVRSCGLPLVPLGLRIELL